MSTNKDDYNHLGLTDSEVLQSKGKEWYKPVNTPPSVLLYGNFILRNLRTRSYAYC